MVNYIDIPLLMASAVFIVILMVRCQKQQNRIEQLELEGESGPKPVTTDEVEDFLEFRHETQFVRIRTTKAMADYWNQLSRQQRREYSRELFKFKPVVINGETVQLSPGK